ncbi:unnamed protein product [Closterium sp. NIES-65]|nr:unnamed protein product [Closterium sp. NIES-65]
MRNYRWTDSNGRARERSGERVPRRLTRSALAMAWWLAVLSTPIAINAVPLESTQGMPDGVGTDHSWVEWHETRMQHGNGPHMRRDRHDSLFVRRMGVPCWI